MKKTFFNISVLAILFSTFVSCKKESEDNGTNTGPDITYVTSGFLCTIGVGRNYVIDTLVVHPTRGIEKVLEYRLGFTPQTEELYISNNSNGTVSLKLKIPLSLSNGTQVYTQIGLYGSNLPVGPENFYPIQLAKAASFETDLILKRNATDGKKFSLESKAVPGYYLSAIHPGVQYQPNLTTETKLAFTTKKQEFFFLPK